MANDASQGKRLETQQSLTSTLPSELTLDFLKKITNDFSPDRKIGQSAFGTYYKVWLLPRLMHGNPRKIIILKIQYLILERLNREFLIIMGAF